MSLPTYVTVPFERTMILTSSPSSSSSSGGPAYPIPPTSEATAAEGCGASRSALGSGGAERSPASSRLITQQPRFFPDSSYRTAPVSLSSATADFQKQSLTL